MKISRNLILLVGFLYLCCYGSLVIAKDQEDESKSDSGKEDENKESKMIYKDAKQPIESRIKDLLKRMTLAEKIGQMTQIERVNATSDVMKSYFIGSVLSGGGSGPAQNATPQQWVDMVNEMQKGALETRLGIPMIYGIDAVHGHNNVYKATIFPHNVGLGVTRDPKLVKRIGAATALEVRATGIPYAFAPCVAVCRDPRWGRCYESYSEDVKIVQNMTEIITGLQGDFNPKEVKKGYPFVAGKDKVAACSKHFVGDGGTVNGINENNTIVNEKQLMEIHMPPYYNSMDHRVSTVMISYSSINGKKMHANHDLVTGFLKNKLGFQGFVISDWEGIDRITPVPHSNYSYSIEASVNAGIDMIMVPYLYDQFIGNLTELVKNNVIPMSRIDDAVKRILRVKFAMGLFENPWGDYSFVDKVGCKHRKLARQAVRKSLVLLKNGKAPNQPLLPLPKKASKILVAGTHADNLGFQCGGWTIEWQGASGNNWTEGTTILKAIKTTVDQSTNVVFQEDPDTNFIKSNNFEYAIVVVGEKPYAETKGDNLNLTLPAPGPNIINNVCQNIKCVVVLVSGRPLVMEPHLPTIDALVAAWLPGSEGTGVADVLFGDHPFTGKLARTWFKRVEQLPMNFGDPNYDPLFPFGFGIETRGRK